MYDVISLKENELLMITSKTENFNKTKYSTFFYDLVNKRKSEDIEFPNTIVTSNLDDEKYEYVMKWYNDEEKLMKPHYDYIINNKKERENWEFKRKIEKLRAEEVKKITDKLDKEIYDNDEVKKIESKLVELRYKDELKEERDEVKKGYDKFDKKFDKKFKFEKQNLELKFEKQTEIFKKELDRKHNLSPNKLYELKHEIRIKWIKDYLLHHTDLNEKNKNKILEIYEKESLERLHMDKGLDNFENMDVTTNEGIYLI